MVWTRVLRTKLRGTVRSGRDLGGSANRTCWYVGCEKWWKQWCLAGFGTERLKPTEHLSRGTIIPVHHFMLCYGAWKILEKRESFLFIFGLPKPLHRSCSVSICGMNGRHRGKSKIFQLDRIIAAVLKTTGRVVWYKNKGCNFLAKTPGCLQVKSTYKTHLWIEKYFLTWMMKVQK